MDVGHLHVDVSRLGRLLRPHQTSPFAQMGIVAPVATSYFILRMDWSEGCIGMSSHIVRDMTKSHAPVSAVGSTSKRSDFAGPVEHSIALLASE